MKKVLLLLGLLLSCKLQAQQGTVFKIKYLPNKEYTAAVTIKLNGHFSLSGDEQAMQKLKSQGINSPVDVIYNIKMIGYDTTGTSEAHAIFPLVMKWQTSDVSENINGNEVSLPQLRKTFTIYNHIMPDGKVVADSAVEEKKQATSKMVLFKSDNAFQNQVKFPNKQLKLGDTFTQDLSIEIPLGATNIPANAKTTYTLISIADGYAYFDIAQNIDVTTPVKQGEPKVTGTGSGNVVYSISDSLITNFDDRLNLLFGGYLTNVKIEGPATMETKYSYSIK